MSSNSRVRKEWSGVRHPLKSILLAALQLERIGRPTKLMMIAQFHDPHFRAFCSETRQALKQNRIQNETLPASRALYTVSNDPYTDYVQLNVNENLLDYE